MQGKFGGRGNFELVRPLASGGARHLARDNDAAGSPWSESPGTIGADQRFTAASLIESNFGSPGHGNKLEVVLRSDGGRNLHYWRMDGPPWSWAGLSAALTG